MGKLIDVPYFQQPKNSAKCGAACAVMLIKHYLGKKSDIDDVWKNVSAISPELHREYCRTYRIGAYLSKVGLRSCTVRYSSLQPFLLFCNEKGIAPIINHKSFEDRIAGHFSVVKNISNNLVIINDPENKKRKSVPLSELELMGSKSGENDEVGGNTAILPISTFDFESRPCPSCGEDIDISFTKLANRNNRLVIEDLCQTCDRFSSSQ
ncbi:hypothetical protein CXF83_08530 [Shewanella sp. Choline-02u-19]|uniref:cysteine peptidase family C39 domain-containing protein n=1 Tax=unclassified Shewanella TaxID=196818 RepID=UPI000C338F7B|nr:MULTISPECIES: papain-like cysteine protease family protein [unclassified Shewanella]PKH61689.1 hypothetical protein CXF84_01500 [Shewanella sp. Bg11-22]PKI26779.1 hypothetical protein CXF83_08530 [Shewanella sp. Choline-02u-19]